MKLGVKYRWDDSLSAFFGFQVSAKFNMDTPMIALNNYNSETHRFIRRFQPISKEKKLKSPRFF